MFAHAQPESRQVPAPSSTGTHTRDKKPTEEMFIIVNMYIFVFFRFVVVPLYSKIASLKIIWIGLYLSLRPVAHLDSLSINRLQNTNI